MLELVFAALFVVVIAWIVGHRSQLRLRVRLGIASAVVAVLITGLYVVTKRFAGGLGAVTHLSDQFPWGIWIGFDLCAIALAAGGFVLAATVHIFHARRFEPILRPVVLTSFLAYLTVAAILVLDLGRPYRFWHPLILWQPHSVMFEITLCLTFYSLILIVEFSPAVFERLRWHGVASVIRGLTLPVVIIGVILSTLHQSSFGSLFLIVPQKLSPLWYTPILPILFLVSAIAAGLATVIVESHLCKVFLNQQLPQPLLVDLGRLCSRLLLLYLLIKLGDVWWRGAWRVLPSTPWLASSFLFEVIGGIAVPAIWLGQPRANPRRLVTGAALVIGGVVLNRLNVSWLGILPYTGPIYVPSWMELASTMALALASLLAFLGISRFLPVFPDPSPAGHDH